MNNNEFKKYVNDKFNGKISYDGEYVSLKKTPKLIFRCSVEDHDEPFEVRTEWIFRDRCKTPCPFCNGKYNDKIVRKVLNEKFGDRITLISKWEYGKTDMLHTDLIFNCKFHGNFTEKLNNVLHYKYGCSKCAYDESNAKKHEKPINDLKEILSEFNIQFNKNDYINVNTPIPFYRDGELLFKRAPGKILYEGHISNIKYSTGEYFIAKFLEKNNIKFTFQKTYEDLIFKRNLRYDFYLDDYNCILEYDGTQHNDKNSIFYDPDIVIKDKLKDEYAFKNNIRMMRIIKHNNHRLSKNKKALLEEKIIEFLTSSTTIERFDV